MFRATVTDAGRGFGHHDHWCWVYDEPGEFRAAAGEFLADGVAHGMRSCYVADRAASALRDDLRDLDRTTRDAVEVLPLREQYANGWLVEPAGPVAAYAAATERALATGFTGLRVAVEATPLTRGPDPIDAIARYEHLVDRYMAGRPLSALCAYSRAELGEETTARIASLHPGANETAAGFRLHASTCAAIALSGELDWTSLDHFTLALRSADPRPTGGELVIDASDLAYIDHRSLFVLAEHVRRWNATAVLVGDLPGARRMIDILDLPDVRIEGPA